MSSLRQVRSQIQQAAERIIAAIEAWPKQRRVDSRDQYVKAPSLSAFRRLEPIGFGLPSDDDIWVFEPSLCSADLVWPLHVGYAVDHVGENNDALAIRMYRTVTAKEVRGFASRFGRYMVRADIAQTVFNGLMMTHTLIHVWLNGKWVDARKGTQWFGDYVKGTPFGGGSYDLREGEFVQMGTAFALRHRYEWAVALGFENTPSIRFATDPTGMKDIFRIRDLPEGRDRRAALLTWITDHWRQHRYDPEIEIYVRKHLRGSIRFGWRGMEAEVLPAPFDVEQRDKFKAEREAMRVAGTDRRSIGSSQ